MLSGRPQLVLALDAHGGDHGPAVTLPAALDALERAPGLSIAAVGLEQAVRPFVETAGNPRLRWVAAESVLAADARPVSVLRAGAGSSLGAAIEQVRSGQAQACVSAASTVALVALSVRNIGTLEGIRRAALMSAIPTAGGVTRVLDLGANLNVDALQLIQFAIMGSVVCERSPGALLPRVGLLNVGHEDSKGHAVVREAHARLQQLPLNYQGFIEGHDIFAGRVDVAVCDGFAGNLLLKSSEGLARMLLAELRSALTSGARARLGGWLARPALQRTLAPFDPSKHNGAPLLGLRGVVIKSHGGSGRAATTQALLEAMREARSQVPERIEDRIREYEAKNIT